MSALRRGLWRVLLLWPVPAVVLLWYVAARAGWLGNPFVLPSPGAVADRAGALWTDGRLPADLAATLGRVLFAFGLALLVGGVVGLAIGRIPLARAALRPFIAFGFPVPKIAAFPALVILFGLGSASKVALGFAEAVFPIAVATAAAASQVPTALTWSAQAMGASGPAVLWRVVLPGSLPGLLAGARVGLVGAVIGVYVAEMIVSSEGLGHLLVQGWRSLETDTMYTSVLSASALGFVLDRLLLSVRERLTHWTH